jgi:DNA polymerase III epsilon subunit-like protein
MHYPHPLIALDTETGGTLPSRHALLSIAANLWLAGNDNRWGYSCYILPAEGKIVEPDAAAKNGYTPERWAELDAVPLQDAMINFEVWLKRIYKAYPTARLLAHNAGFDKAFLEEAAAMTGVDLPIRHAWRCSMDKFGTLVDRGILPEGTLKLERLAELSGHHQHDIHTSYEDADLCYHGYLWLLKTEAEHYAKQTTNN